jgi:hypothetical protein
VQLIPIRRFAAAPSSHLGGIGGDLMAAFSVANDLPNLCSGGSVTERHGGQGSDSRDPETHIQQ